MLKIIKLIIALSLLVTGETIFTWSSQAPNAPFEVEVVVSNGDCLSSATTFCDVPHNHTFYYAIEALYQASLTTGCHRDGDHLFFCPDDFVKRQEMAALVIRRLSLDLNYPWLYDNRGAARAAKGNYDRASADFNQAIKLKPYIAEFYHNRDTILLRLGKEDQAIVAPFSFSVASIPNQGNDPALPSLLNVTSPQQELYLYFLGIDIEHLSQNGTDNQTKFPGRRGATWLALLVEYISNITTRSLVDVIILDEEFPSINRAISRAGFRLVGKGASLHVEPVPLDDSPMIRARNGKEEKGLSSHTAIIKEIG